MKKIIFFAFLLTSMAGFSQTNPANTLPPYKKFPSVPPFKLFLVDSSTYFTKDNLNSKKATMLMLFSPDCDHCKHETEEIIKHMDSFKNVQIIMATPLDFTKMKEYYNKYDLKRFKNITMGRDANFMLPTFYNIKSFPLLAFYNKKKQLISAFEGSMPIEKAIAEIKK